MCCDVTSQVGRQKPQRAPEIASGTPVTGRRMGVCSRRPSPRNTIACLTLIRSGGWWSSSLSASCFPKYDSGPVSFFASMVFGFHLLNEHVCVCVCAVRYRDERRRVFTGISVFLCTSTGPRVAFIQESSPSGVAGVVPMARDGPREEEMRPGDADQIRKSVNWNRINRHNVMRPLLAFCSPDPARLGPLLMCPFLRRKAGAKHTRQAKFKIEKLISPACLKGV